MPHTEKPLSLSQVKETYPTTTYKNCFVNAPAASIAGPIVAASVRARAREGFRSPPALPSLAPRPDRAWRVAGLGPLCRTPRRAPLAQVPKRSRDKTMLLGAKFEKELHEFIDPANLPQKLGGTLEDGVQSSKKGKAGKLTSKKHL